MTKSIIFDIGGVLFEQRNDAEQPWQPIKQGIEILTKCAESARLNNHRLFICTNMTDAGVAILHNAYPDIFNTFHGVVTCTSAQAKKPHPQIFKYLIDTHSLAADYTLFIDDQLQNVQAAESVGIIGIHAFDFEHVHSELIKHGVL